MVTELTLHRAEEEAKEMEQQRLQEEKRYKG